MRPVKSLPPSEQQPGAAGFNNAYPPLHMQQTQYAQQINMPMENGEDGDIPDEGDALLDNNDNNQNNYWKCIMKTMY